MRLIIFCFLLLVTAIVMESTINARGPEDGRSATAKTGFAAKRPVFGGACKTCPWGSIADFVKAAMQFYGYNVQICYNCAGGPAEARLVAGAKMPPPLQPMPPGIDIPNYLIPAPPDGPIDFGATGAQFLWDAYRGVGDFAKDPEGARKNLRIIANIQEPSYYVIAVRDGSGITDLRDIVAKHMPVQVLASSTGGQNTPEVLQYYGITKEKMASFGGALRENAFSPDQRKGLDVFIGWAALENAPEYNMWYDVSQRYDLKYLDVPKDLRDKLIKDFDLEAQDLPVGLLRGVDRPIPTVARTGNVIYGRTDMPDTFAYTLAKAVDEHQNLLQWANGGMNFSYNSHTVWKAFGVPLHPGAAKYYKEKRYMK